MRFANPLLSAPVLAAMLCLSLLAVAPRAAAAGPAIGSVPPSALGKDASGKPVSLTAMRGKVVVVAFWMSSCGYCLREVPALDNLQKQLATSGLQAVAVNTGDGKKDYGEMLRQMRGYSLVLAHDLGGTVVEDWGVRMYPNLWVLDPEGRVVAHHEGYAEDALPGILAEIRRIVAAHQPVPAS